MRRAECTREAMKAKGWEPASFRVDDKLEDLLAAVRGGAKVERTEPKRFREERQIITGTPADSYYPRYETVEGTVEYMDVEYEGHWWRAMKKENITKHYQTASQRYMGD